jgi:hypothetical protein
MMGGGGSGRLAPVFNLELRMKPNRAEITSNLFFPAMIALFATLSPRMTYWAECLLIGRFAPVYCDVTIGQIDAALAVLALCLSLYLGYRCYRASGVVAELKRQAHVARPMSLSEVIGHTTYPLPLAIAFASLLIAPLWLSPLIAAFGHWAKIAGAVWWMVVSLSTLCYVGALCVYDVERTGESPSTSLLSAGYNLGGAPGVWLAHRALPQSRTLAEFVKIPPFAALFMGAIVIIALLIKLT